MNVESKKEVTPEMIEAKDISETIACFSGLAQHFGLSLDKEAKLKLCHLAGCLSEERDSGADILKLLAVYVARVVVFLSRV